MSSTKVRLTAKRVDCSEALGGDIMQVVFDSETSDFDEENRSTPYLLVSVCFEFGRCIAIEYHDGKDYYGDNIRRFELWRTGALAVLSRGIEFEIEFNVTDDAFVELQDYLRTIFPRRVYRYHHEAGDNAG
jgi:hypothetical protein